MTEEMHNIELILILALYYFDKGKNVEGFTKQYNRYFEKDVSPQTILFSVAKFRNVDPANNIKSSTDNDEYVKVWHEYIVKEKYQELKIIYTDFKKGIYIKNNFSNDEITFIENPDYSILSKKIIDSPQIKPEDYMELGGLAYPRRREVACNALAMAKYKCETNCENELFYKKDMLHFYTEAHHLIPLCYQEYFEYSLDVEANVVSLCPMCHRRVHYGANPDTILQKLYIARRLRLKKCNINISFEKLLLMYR